MAGTDFAEPDDFAADSCDAFSAPGGKKDFGALFGFSSLPRLLSFGFPGDSKTSASDLSLFSNCSSAPLASSASIRWLARRISSSP